jgi:hypothetical protein
MIAPRAPVTTAATTATAAASNASMNQRQPAKGSHNLAVENIPNKAKKRREKKAD